ncbi:MAG: flagellar biosynthetic protein FliO [Myxococcales bacterium]|nr:flagellar biosynthetic protein FliO [Myxococcales bacterium]
MNACAVLLLSALAASSPQAAEPEVGSLRQRLAAELLAPEPPQAAASVPASAPAEPAVVSASEKAPASPHAGPTVGSAAMSVPAWPALLLLVGLGGVWVWTRRRTPRSAAVPLHRLASLPMGGRRSLVLVEVMQQRLLVGCSEKGLSLLARLNGPATEEEPAADADDPSADERAFNRLLDAAEAADRSPAANPGRVPGEQRDLARKLRNLGRI